MNPPATAARRAYLRSDRRSVHLLRGAMSPEECREVLKSTQRHEFSERHAAFATRDVPIYALPPPIYELVLGIVRERIMPALEKLSGLSAATLYTKDLFLVRYSCEEGEQRALELHQDGALLSFTLLLSQPEDFEGGGTFFEHLRRTIRPGNAGTAVLHHSGLLHAGTAISSGTRFVLVGFVEAGDEAGLKPIDRIRLQIGHIRARQRRGARLREMSGVDEAVLEGALSLLVGDESAGGEEEEEEGEPNAVTASAFSVPDGQEDDFVVTSLWTNSEPSTHPHDMESIFPSSDELLLSAEEGRLYDTAPEAFTGSPPELLVTLLRTVETEAMEAARIASLSARRRVVLSITPEDPAADMEALRRRLFEHSKEEGVETSTSGLVWGEWRLRPFVYGIVLLEVAAELPAAIPLDMLVEDIEAVDGVSSCKVLNSRSAPANA